MSGEIFHVIDNDSIWKYCYLAFVKNVPLSLGETDKGV